MSLAPRLLPAARTALAALLVVLALVPAQPAAASSPTTAEFERDFVALVNVERAKQSLGALQVKGDIVTVARRHSAKMASDNRLHHNPNFSKEITGWQRVAENVGVGPSVDALHRALMASEGHRRNIMDSTVTEIGVGVVISGGRVWVTQNFRRPRSGVTVSPPTLTTFGDVSSRNAHASSIDTVSNRGITDPCGNARYCPDGRVTRGEFSLMLVAALDLPLATNASRFADVKGQQAAAAETLAANGLTTGCSATTFCPDAQLTREQMATFFARALHLAPASSPFRDVTTTHAGSVGALYREGIVTGCTATTFCPRQRVTRAQTASMIARNLG